MVRASTVIRCPSEGQQSQASFKSTSNSKSVVRLSRTDPVEGLDGGVCRLAVDSQLLSGGNVTTVKNRTGLTPVGTVPTWSRENRAGTPVLLAGHRGR
jgi:hypothetical protein